MEGSNLTLFDSERTHSLNHSLTPRTAKGFMTPSIEITDIYSPSEQVRFILLWHLLPWSQENGANVYFNMCRWFDGDNGSVNAIEPNKI